MKRTMPHKTKTSPWPVFLALLFFWTAFTSPFAVADEAPPNEMADQESAVRDILFNMTDFLSQASGFSVVVRSSYDAIQPDGQRVEFGERRKILLKRPDRVRVEVERSDGDRNLITFDGQKITAFKGGENLYAQVERPGTVDSAVVYLVRDLQVQFPLARMFMTTLTDELRKQVESASYVEEDHLYEVPVDHIAVRATDVDVQIWVAQGDKPLPQRVVITYKNDPGQPQFRADFLDWNLAPEISGNPFTFAPPEGAEEILFLAPVRESSLPSDKEGGRP